jgi:hypothetical protein
MNISAKLESAANVSTIVASLLLSELYLIPTPRSRLPQAVPESVVGASMKERLPGVGWHKNYRTLVLALSTQCGLCSESAPSLRRLADEARKNAKIVAVFPQPVLDAEQYLAAEGVRVDEVKEAGLSDIGARGTPTILLVNERAVVTNIWEGRIDAREQAQVLRLLLGETTKDSPSTSTNSFAGTSTVRDYKRE